METLSQGAGFDSMLGKATILEIMKSGTYIIGLFSVIFLIYSNSFLAKRRKKEFGLFQILGMEKKHLTKILFFESLYLWAAALAADILLGVLLYRLLFQVLMKLTGLKGTIRFAFSTKAAGMTAALFGIIFLINFLLSLRQIHVSQPVELLHGEAEGEGEPKTKFLTARAYYKIVEWMTRECVLFFVHGSGFEKNLTKRKTSDAEVLRFCVGCFCCQAYQ